MKQYDSARRRTSLNAKARIALGQMILMKFRTAQIAVMLYVAANCLSGLWAMASERATKAERPKPTHHTARDVCGWTVRVDDRLLETNNNGLGPRALKLLEARLIVIAALMPEKALGRLRQVPIQVDLTCGELKSMVYHPSAAWLREAGYDTNLARCVHVPDAGYFASRFETFRQPMAILHELAHAYHDQVLGTDEPRILEAWKRFKESTRYESVLMNTGEMREHYGRVNPQEFFAEMTEAYFGENDFFPFVAGELERAEPEIFSLLCDIWGSLPAKRRSE
jgi:hypothetical protein